MWARQTYPSASEPCHSETVPPVTGTFHSLFATEPAGSWLTRMSASLVMISSVSADCVERRQRRRRGTRAGRRRAMFVTSFPRISGDLRTDHIEKCVTYSS
jgi:hypothetical protein